MKAREVMSILGISRSSLHNYVKAGKLRYVKKHNNQYDYNEDDVYKLASKDVKRMTVIYSRVSTSKQKKDLINQENLLKQWCFSNGYIVQRSFKDVASGISFANRKDFFNMLDLILNYQVEKVVISYKDRLSRVGFELFKHLFERFGCEIVVVSELGSEKLDSAEIFEEIVSLLHCYSMKLYSSRKRKTVEDLIRKD